MRKPTASNQPDELPATAHEAPEPTTVAAGLVPFDVLMLKEEFMVAGEDMEGQWHGRYKKVTSKHARQCWGEILDCEFDPTVLVKRLEKIIRGSAEFDFQGRFGDWDRLPKDGTKVRFDEIPVGATFLWGPSHSGNKGSFKKISKTSGRQISDAQFPVDDASGRPVLRDNPTKHEPLNFDSREIVTFCSSKKRQRRPQRMTFGELAIGDEFEWQHYGRQRMRKTSFNTAEFLTCGAPDAQFDLSVPVVEVIRDEQGQIVSNRPLPPPPPSEQPVYQMYRTISVQGFPQR